MFQKVDCNIYEFNCGKETYIVTYCKKTYTLCGICSLLTGRDCYLDRDNNTIFSRYTIGNAADLERIVTDFNRLITEQYEIDGVKFKECEEKFSLVQN